MRTQVVQTWQGTFSLFFSCVVTMPIKTHTFLQTLIFRYAIPLWSANVFPYVTKAAVETMQQLRAASDATKGREIINRFRSRLQGQVQSMKKEEGDEGEKEEENNSDATQETVETMETMETTETVETVETVEETNKEATKRLHTGCEGEPLCVTWMFQQFWGVLKKSTAGRFATFTPTRHLTFGERAAAIMPGLAYQLQSGYVDKIRGNLKASRDKLKKQLGM
jgi:hypothetical protein